MKKKKKKKLAASGHSSLSATRLAEDLQAVAFVVIRVVLSIVNEAYFVEK